MSKIDDQKLKAIAEKVLDQMKPKDEELFGSVIAILMVISIILTTIRVLQECHKDKVTTFSDKDRYSYFAGQIKQTITRKSWFTKMTIKKTIRRELTRDEYKKYGYDLMVAILNTGENLTDDELITLAEAANV